MKIFISWSGETSRKVAIALRGWLPGVIQCVKPYVSAENIDKGARWSSDIAGELNESDFGILCVTKDNINEPWLNFEAGALGKRVDKSRVCPLLFNMKRSEIKEGPILQFQSTLFEKEDVYKLLQSINKSCEDQAIDDSLLKKVFDSLWPSLESELEKIDVPNGSAESSKEKKTGHSDAHIERILEEVLELSRLNQKLLRSPDEILPPEYLSHVLRGLKRSPEAGFVEPPVCADLTMTFYETVKTFDCMKKAESSSVVADMQMSLDRLGNVIDYIVNRNGADRRTVMQSRDAMRILRNQA